MKSTNSADHFSLEREGGSLLQNQSSASSLLTPFNGFSFSANSINETPRDHTSLFNSLFLLNTSGASYCAVGTYPSIHFIGSNPYSLSFTTPSSQKNRFDGLTLYSLIISIIYYSMGHVLRMKEVQTQQTTTRNLAQFIFIQSHIIVHVFPQGSQFTILQYDLFHYA